MAHPRLILHFRGLGKNSQYTRRVSSHHFCEAGIRESPHFLASHLDYTNDAKISAVCIRGSTSCWRPYRSMGSSWFVQRSRKVIKHKRQKTWGRSNKKHAPDMQRYVEYDTSTTKIFLVVVERNVVCSHTKQGL